MSSDRLIRMIMRQFGNQIIRKLVTKFGGGPNAGRQINQMRRMMRWMR
ncbi:MAG: hypothetical protein JXQ89_05570 [Pelagimonas sp.]